MVIREHNQAKWAGRFFTIWGGQAFSLLGSQLVQFALIWWLTRTTGSATVLATASLVGLLPQVILGPIIGPFVDRWNRRLTMMLADGSIALVTLGLAYLFFIGKEQIWHVYLIMLIRSIAGGFHWPAMAASTSLMVPKEHLSRIQGLNQLLQGVMNIIAAPLGALLISIMIMPGILLIDVGTAILAILPLFFFRVPQPDQQETAIAAKTGLALWWEDFQEGFRYVWSWKGLVVLMGMATMINLLLSPAFSLLPILVTKHFQGEALQLGWLNSALGIGTLLGGLILSLWGGFHKRIFTILMGVTGIGVSTLIIAASPAGLFLMAVAGVFLAGVMLPLANGPLDAILQAVVDPKMQGRVFTLIGSMAGAMTPLGLIVAGPVADAFGVRTWFYFGGATCIVMSTCAFFVPALIHIEDRHAQIPVDPSKITPISE